MNLCKIFNWIFPRRLLKSEDFFKAAKDGTLQVIQDKINLEKKLTKKCYQLNLVSKTLAFANSTNSCGETPLVTACRFGRLGVVRFLVEDYKANVNEVASISHSENSTDFVRGLPIHAAVQSGNIDLVRFLIKEHDVDVNVLSENHQVSSNRKKFYMGGNSPLHYAVFCLRGTERDSMVRFLIEKGADMNLVNNAGHFAWMTDTDNLIHNLKLFIDLGMNVNQQDEFKNTLAHRWAESRDPNALNVIQVLLEVGADFTLKNKDGLTPLMMTALGAGRGKPFPCMFQRIFNTLSHKMSKEEKWCALELIGATFITRSDLKEEDAVKIGVDCYWKMAEKLRLSLGATNETNDVTTLPNVYSSAKESLNNLNKTETSLNSNMDIKLQALQKMESRLGGNSRYFQETLRSYEDQKGMFFLYDSDLACLNWPADFPME